MAAATILVSVVIASTCRAQADSAATTPAGIVLADASNASFAAGVLPHLRNRDLAAALEALDARIDQTLQIGDLIYSDLPSAAAGLNRSLAQASSGEQYALLRDWTLPTTQRQRVRMLTAPVPADRPPKVFARSIGERPRDTTFAVASVGPVDSIFCTGWVLLQAANEIGQLSQLRVKLQTLADERITGARELLVLSQLVGPRGDLDSANSFLANRTRSEDAAVELTLQDVQVVAIAAAALTHEETHAAAVAYLASLVVRAEHGKAIGLRAFLRIAHATAVQVYRGASRPDFLLQNRLKYWVPATVRTGKAIDRGHPSGVWLAHERHLLHLAGGAADVLLFRYPLIGQFDFTCETQEGSAIGTDGGLVYGGLQFQALGRNDQLTVWNADLQHQVQKPTPFARFDLHPVFNRVSIRSTETSVQFESNFHPIWFDGTAARTSPWIGFRSSGVKRPIFRNIRLTGKPTIPRTVNLSAGNELRGWTSDFYAESQPMFHESPGEVKHDEPAEANALYDWQLRDGEILASAHDDPVQALRSGLLQYQRPLLRDESVTYEFHYQDESSIVHPAVGRLAFLLESSGIRLRWITTGESDWTGLERDNAALEPLFRRGPRPLPLKENQWNQVRIQIADENVQIHLNEELVYQRPLEPDASTQLGLYRSSRATPSRIRNVVLKGDWPESVPAEFTSTPLETIDRNGDTTN